MKLGFGRKSRYRMTIGQPRLSHPRRCEIVGLKHSRNADVMQKLEAASETARQGEDKHAKCCRMRISVTRRLRLRRANGNRRCLTALRETPSLIDSMNHAELWLVSESFVVNHPTEEKRVAPQSAYCVDLQLSDA
jgi:hypothetical protein